MDTPETKSTFWTTKISAIQAPATVEKILDLSKPSQPTSPSYCITGATAPSPFHANEDRIKIIHHDLFTCALVLDGHGGELAAQYCQSEFPKVLRRAYVSWQARHLGPSVGGNQEESDDRQQGDLGKFDLEHIEAGERNQVTIEELLTQCVVTLDEAYCVQAKRVGDTSGACFLAAVAFVHAPLKMYIVNAGDCRALLVSRDTHFRALSRDHKASCPHERKRICLAGGRIARGRIDGVLEPSRGVGDIDLKTSSTEGSVIAIPEIQTLDSSEAGGVIVLATDGIWDELSNADVAQLVVATNNQTSKSTLPRTIIEKAEQARGSDDKSVIVIQFMPSQD